MGLRQQHWGGCSAQEWCRERRPVASIEACGKVRTGVGLVATSLLVP